MAIAYHIKVNTGETLKYTNLPGVLPKGTILTVGPRQFEITGHPYVTTAEGVEGFAVNMTADVIIQS